MLVSIAERFGLNQSIFSSASFGQTFQHLNKEPAMSTLIHRIPAVVSTRPALLLRLWRSATRWAQAVWQARQARAAMYRQLQALRVLDCATLRDLGMSEMVPHERTLGALDYERGRWQ
jgi:hypothetical protein